MGDTTQQSSIYLPAGSEMSEYDYSNMPRDEIENYKKERSQIFQKIQDLQEALKNDAIKEDFETIVK